MTTTFETANVGDRVWSMRSGWVEIVETGHSERYRINVRNRDGINESYTLCGRHYHNDLNQSLFWDEIVIEAPTKPLPDLPVEPIENKGGDL